MLKALIKKQLQEVLQNLIHRQKNGKKTSGKGMLTLLVIGLVYLVAMFTGMSILLGKQLFQLNLGWLYFLLLGAVSVVFGTIGSVFSTCFSLYMAKDNDLLLSMPIPIRNIILSRLMGVYLMGLLYSGTVSLPAVVVSWIVGSCSFAAVVGGLLLVALISGIVLGLSCLLGWVVAKISQKLKNRSFLIVLLSLALLGAYFYFYFKIMNRLPELIENVVLIGGKIRDSLYPIYLFGRLGEGDWLAMLVWTLGVILLLGLIWLMLKSSFLAISTATPTPKRAVYQEKTAVRRSASSALLRKEWLRFSKSANYMLNCGLGLLFLIAFGVFLLIQREKILELASFLLRSYPGAIPVMLCAVTCSLVGMVDITAPSVSLEGRAIWQLQSIPVTPWQVLWTKLKFHLLIASVPTLFCTIATALVTPAATEQLLLMVLLPLLSALFFALFGLVLGLRFVNLTWTNEIVPIKQGGAVTIAIFSAMGLAILVGGPYLWFGHKLGATVYLGAFCLLLLIADLALFRWLKTKGTKHFESL